MANSPSTRKSPNQRTTQITFKDHPDRGDSTWTFDGRTGWIKTPRGLFSMFELVGGELDGARLEAQLAFPGQIKQDLTIGERVLSERSTTRII